ncbi:hypothetical protein OROMI_001855 [Orobanche minor]
MGRTWLAKATFLWFLVYIPVIPANAVDSEHLNIWPMPSSVTSGHGSLYVSNNFELKTEGSKFLDVSGILKDAFLRSIDLIRATHVIEANNSKIDPLLVLKGIRVLVVWPSDEFAHGINESYKLQIPDPNNPLYAHIEAQTVYGALHGLQWIPSYPKLWDAAYSVYERYTFADAAEIVSYAKRRGINVLAEIDVPGHAQSCWGVGYPSIWPSTDCKEPLDVSNEFTFTLIDGILSDFSCWESTPHVRN